MKKSNTTIIMTIEYPNQQILIHFQAIYYPPRPHQEKPGVCPASFGQNNGQFCNNDYDCPSKLKCCFLGFVGVPTCTYPDGIVYPEPEPVIKPGRCPPQNFGSCVQGCRNDGDCFGNQKCCFNGCGYTCRRPFSRRY